MSARPGPIEGHRNDGFFWACCRALEAGYVDLSLLEQAAAHIGLSDTEVSKTMASAHVTVTTRARHDEAELEPPQDLVRLKVLDLLVDRAAKAIIEAKDEAELNAGASEDGPAVRRRLILDRPPRTAAVWGNG